MNLSTVLDDNINIIKERLPIDKSFDIIGRNWTIGDINCYMVYIDGFTKDQIMLYLMKFFQDLNMKDPSSDIIKNLMNSHIPYIEVEAFTDFEKMKTSVLSGALALFVDGLNTGIIIDVREYPVRGPQEPDLERVTRGSRDGLVETIVFNTALIRRRIRDPELIFEMTNVGKESRTDIAITYINNRTDQKLLDRIRKKISEIDVSALVMGEKTLDELLVYKKWYNPLPLVRFSERPDVVAAHLLEGHIAIIVDNSPSVMLLPATIFHFTQHAEDYYQNPVVGTYLRWVRFLALFFSVFVTPIWLLLVFNVEMLPESLKFIGPKETGTIPLFLQFIILELGLDFLRIASIHTPNVLSTSLGIIGGLILSEFAVSVGWFVPEAILYMAIAGICTFASPSVEFGWALRIFRLILLLMTGIFKTIGFIVGVLIIIIIISKTKAFGGQSYLWPLIPFDKNAFLHILLRKPIPEVGNKEK